MEMQMDASRAVFAEREKRREKENRKRGKSSRRASRSAANAFNFVDARRAPVAHYANRRPRDHRETRDVINDTLIEILSARAAIEDLPRNWDDTIYNINQRGAITKIYALIRGATWIRDD